ncbi:MAG: type II toxin-antitoxin system HicB family antitoxin [Vicinamibacterales bacterium]
MPAHEEVLEAARRIGSTRGDWTFTPDEIVKALPHLNASTVRTHVVSRCCVNSPQNHDHQWPYFKRVRRGWYVVLPPMRRERKVPAVERVAEAQPVFGARSTSAHLREAVHAFVSRSDGWFVAECLELPVVTQGRTLDETLANLKDAVTLFLEDEDAAHLGLTPDPRLVMTYETSLRGSEA